MGATKLMYHFSNGAKATMGVSDIAEESVSLLILKHTSHCLSTIKSLAGSPTRLQPCYLDVFLRSKGFLN